VLPGEGKGNFEPLPSVASGIRLKGEVWAVKMARLGSRVLLRLSSNHQKSQKVASKSNNSENKAFCCE